MKRAMLMAAAVVTVMMGLGGWAATSSAGASGGTTFTLVGHQTNFQLVDQPPKGDSGGDLGTLSGTLSRDGAPAGRYQGYCVQIDAHDHSQCQFTFALPEGQIVFENGYGPGINGNKVAQEPIVGGTGAYATARGYSEARDTGKNTFEEVIHLAD